jgi:hypothetical protein
VCVCVCVCLCVCVCAYGGIIVCFHGVMVVSQKCLKGVVGLVVEVVHPHALRRGELCVRVYVCECDGVTLML